MRILLLIIACLCLMEAYAEGKKEKRNRLSFYPEHELFLGVGAYPFPAGIEEEDTDIPWNDNWVHFDGDSYQGGKYTSGAWFIGYSYRVKRWLSFCISASYAAYWQKLRKYGIKRESRVNREYYIGLVPTVRFTWLDRKYVRMYTTVGMGITLQLNNGSGDECCVGTSNGLATPEFIPLGISVGKDWYGFAEVGGSHHGIVSMGMGYRFNKNRQKR